MRRAAVAALAIVGGAAFWLARVRSAQRLEVRAPTPVAGLSAPGMDSLAPSLLSVPVRVDLAPLIRAVETAIPLRWGDLEERLPVPGRDRLYVAVQVERGPLTARFENTVAVLSTTLSYRARAWYDPPLLPEVSTGCGLDESAPAPRLSVTLVSPLSLDGGWRLRSQVRAGRLAPHSADDRDRCTVTALDLDMTERVVAQALRLLERRGPEADRALAAVDVRSLFAYWWEAITEPIRLTDDVWLVLAPETVAHSGIEGSGDQVETTLVVRARPRVVMGARPEVTPVPLPPLDSTGGGGSLVVHAEARAEYGEISERLRAAVAGRRWEAGRRSVQVRDVRLAGVGDGRISVAVRVDGDASGTLYLVGTPSYDPATGQVGIPDLDFDVATRDALVSGAAFLARVRLAEYLRSEARWPATPALDWAREQVTKGFNARLTDQVRLEGSVTALEIVEVAADTASLRVRVAVTGKVALVVRNRPPPTGT